VRQLAVHPAGRVGTPADPNNPPGRESSWVGSEEWAQGARWEWDFDRDIQKGVSIRVLKMQQGFEKGSSKFTGGGGGSPSSAATTPRRVSSTAGTSSSLGSAYGSASGAWNCFLPRLPSPAFGPSLGVQSSETHPRSRVHTHAHLAWFAILSEGSSLSPGKG
jgi:hypothetical protein